MDAMTEFTRGDPETVHHLPRDTDLLIELPENIQIDHLVADRYGLR